jgi:predicted DNA-binding transcriptional regulator AlpA
MKNDTMRPSTPAAAPSSNRPLSAREAAGHVGLSQPAFWRAVAAGRLPSPVYPAPRAPRWFPSELRAALEALRCTPAEAKAARRSAKLARSAA